MRSILYWIILICLLVGCSSGPSVTPSASLPTLAIALPSSTMPPITATTTTTLTLLAPTTISSRPTETPLPFTPIPTCATFFYEGNAQVELIGPDGRRVLIDVYDPKSLSSPATQEDILLTTHTHWDHVNSDFLAAFPGKHLMTEAGIIELPGLHIVGIASAHLPDHQFKPKGGSNYIYLVDIGELRIAHFGDIGQQALTAEQLDVLGRVDVAITQFANPYSDMSAENRKGFNLMEQVHPRLIIPTHINLDTAKIAAAQWQGLYSDHDSVQICESYLNQETQILFMGQAATQFAERLRLAKVDW